MLPFTFPLISTTQSSSIPFLISSMLAQPTKSSACGQCVRDLPRLYHARGSKRSMITWGRDESWQEFDYLSVSTASVLGEQMWQAEALAREGLWPKLRAPAKPTGISALKGPRAG